MPRFLVVGYGRVGSRTARFLRELYPSGEIIVVDTVKSRVEEARKQEGVEAYLYEPGILGRLGERVDIAVTALPSTTAWRSILELASKCISVVDVSFIPEDPYVLDKIVEDCRAQLIVDAGFAPGYSNIVAGYVYHKLGLRDTIEIRVGGIPQKPIPPIGYVVTWNARDLLEEYTRPARYIENEEVKSKDPLSDVKLVEIKELGVFEAFLSDGLRTMLRNLKPKNLREYTLRWPGHIVAIRLLRDLGFLSATSINVNGIEVKPIDFTASILERTLRGRVDDMAILEVVAIGKDSLYRELCVLKGTLDEPATPLFTALVHAYSVKVVLERRVKPGVIAPEELYEYKSEYEEYLRSHGVEIIKEQITRQ